jgi:hypothetical protein
MTRYEINDALVALANQAGAEISDAELNELTHTVADALGLA